jgi:hypothetical protein
MPRTGRPTEVIELSDTERNTLQRWTRRHKSSPGMAVMDRARLRRRPVEPGGGGRPAGSSLDHGEMASPVRRRSPRGLCDAPRPGSKRTVADETVEKVLVDTLESAPGADTHWSTRAWPKGTGSERRPWPRFGGRSASGVRYIHRFWVSCGACVSGE